MENEQFDVAAVMDWLDRRIEATENLRATDDFNSQIGSTVTPDYIQITFGIDIVADLLGKKLEEDGKVDEYTKYCFQYKGWKVFELSKERLVGA